MIKSGTVIHYTTLKYSLLSNTRHNNSEITVSHDPCPLPTFLAQIVYIAHPSLKRCPLLMYVLCVAFETAGGDGALVQSAAAATATPADGEALLLNVLKRKITLVLIHNDL